MTKPPRLKPGDTVAVLSPSWGGPSRFPHVYDLGVESVKRLGLRVKEYPTARMDADALYENPRIRAEDLNRAFADPEVNAIFATIGGDDSVRILPFLDFDAILASPKVLMGYSDTTTMTSSLSFRGMVAFNGPAIMAGFAQMAHLPSSFENQLREFFFGDWQTWEYRPYERWANQYADWNTPGYAGELAGLRDNLEGWRWLQGDQRVEGRLFGGCIEVHEFMKATPFWPDLDFWNDRILFFETSEDKPPVANVKYMLRNYGSMGALDRVAGVLFGRARDYSDTEKAELDRMLVQVIAGEFGRRDMPIVSNLDFGHTDPQWILPLGVLAEICPQTKRFGLLESPFAP